MEEGFRCDHRKDGADGGESSQRREAEMKMLRFWIGSGLNPSEDQMIDVLEIRAGKQGGG